MSAEREGVHVYVRKLCGTQLLGELLLDRANVKVMMRYVSDSKNLQMMMMLLKDNSRSIQFEAFHVFKVSLSSDDSCVPPLYIYSPLAMVSTQQQLCECS